MTDKDLITNLNAVRISGYKLLSVRAQALYRQKCKELFDEGELRRSYLQSLLTWADNYDRYWRLRDDCEVEGYSFTSHNKFGDPVVSANPKVKMMNDALRVANSILSEFGATLKQARKLGKEKKTKDPLEEW